MLRNGGVEDNPGFELVVHPPLGKQLIAIGECAVRLQRAAGGSSAALAGVLRVLLIIRVGPPAHPLHAARRRSPGVLLICDGALARPVADGHARRLRGAVRRSPRSPRCVCDRDDVRARMAARRRRGPDRRLPATARGSACAGGASATGVLLGLGCAVKWSGVYWIVAFARAHRDLGPHGPPRRRRAAAVGRARSCATSRPPCGRWRCVPVLVYLADWWAWFASETGIDRNVVGYRARTARPGRSVGVRPDALRSLWYYSGQVLDFHAGLTDAAGGAAPVGVQAVDVADGAAADALLLRVRRRASRAAATDDCVSAVMLIGTPALWWPALPVLGVGAVAGGHPARLALRRRARRLRRRASCRGSPTSTGRCTSST